VNWLEQPPRHLFFTGKGGVGKTSIASAAAVTLADRGFRVLLVSTDPASNLDDVLGVSLSRLPTPIPGVPGLDALNIDPEAAARAYRERVVGPYRDALPEETVRGIEEQLSGACTVEVAAFDEFTMLLGHEGLAAEYDHILFDTAPTGHTIRLLQLPAAWSNFLEANERGASCLGPASGLQMQQQRYTDTVLALADAGRTVLVLVARPEVGALAEAARSSAELAELGLRNQQLVVNGIFRATDREDRLAMALEDAGNAALATMPPALRSLPQDEVPLRSHNVVGIEAVRAFLASEQGNGGAFVDTPDALPDGIRTLAELIDDLARQEYGLVMVMGKGGVGKTSVAAAIATQLAARGRDVHLTTTDPAAHVAKVAGDAAHLRVSRIDPRAETEAYRAKVLERSGRDLDAEGRALLEEDLRSPCTEEVAVFHAFSRVVAGARRELVVVDTAPTGHSLLLLDAAGSYHREMMRNAAGLAASVTTPLMRLRDPAYSRILLVTLAETTPVLEAAALRNDLRRAGIEPYGWIINSSLAAARTSDPLLVRRAAEEIPQIEKVTELAERVYLVPRLDEDPVGARALARMVDNHALHAEPSA
jgi:arsenite/tail-anchored protein-transporting ATPase